MKCSEGRVWLPDPTLVWVEGEIVGTQADDKLRVRRVCDGEVVVVAAGTTVLKNAACEEGGDDLAALSHLDEANVLHNLALRFQASQIYTWTGKILMALNPWRSIVGLYSDERLEEHCLPQSDASIPAPHVFAVANHAYRSMLADGRRQCILVSGESGSGKTETTKYLMQQLAAVSSVGGRSEVDNMHISTEEQVLNSNPLLEAFGNARTLRNDNSSRFGKFLMLQFESGDDAYNNPKISGATIQTYLLEKSRVVRVASGERNYHIFHQLCQAAVSSEVGRLAVPDDLQLQDTHFRILGEAIEDIRDQERFKQMHSALLSIGVPPEEWSGIVHTLAGLLHLGNIEFLADTEKKGSSDVDTAVLKDEESAQQAARLFECDAETLKESVLSRKVKTVEETVTVNYSREQAETARDSLLKAIYGKIFTRLIQRVNSSLARNSCNKQGAGYEDGEMKIGILDIFGFESFAVNGFEQFCINYANEKLQLQFNNFVFMLEQAEYEREKIPWTHIDFNDNQPCIDIIESRPGGILDILDEECRIPRGSDDGFVSKARAIKSQHVNGPKRSMEVFTVVHYAGDVSYNRKGFLERNKDSLGSDLIDLVCGSKSTFLSSLFGPAHESSSMASGQHSNALECKRGTLKTKGGSKINGKETVGAQFKRQLSSLMDTIESAQPHYIRCINTNSSKAAGKYEPALVVHQLRCGGVVEAVRVTRARYPARFLVADFLRRFSCLQKEESEDASEQLRQMHDIMRLAGLVEAIDYQVGVSKVFLRDGRIQTLQTRLASIVERSALRIAGNVRMWLARRTVAKKSNAVTLLQGVLRRVGARHCYMLSQSDKCAATIQAAARSSMAQRHFRSLSAAAKRMQVLYRQRNLAQLPKLVAKLEETRSEMLQLQELNRILTAQLEDESAQVRMAQLETMQVQSDMACRLQELESQMHAERMQKEEAEDLVTQAEEALIRVRKAKDAAEDSRQLLEQDVETLQSQVEQLTQRNEQLEAENERNKTYVAELSRQKARLSKLCGLRPARVSPGVSPRTSPLFNFKTSSTRSPASSKFKSPVSSSMSRPSSSTISRPSTSPSLRINATARSQAATSSPEASGGSICNTSYCPLITQNVLSSFAGDISPTSLSTPSPVSSPAAAASPVFGSTIQGSMTVISGSESMEKLTKKSHTIPASPDFGRHSKERAERQERKSCSPVPPLGGGNTPWKQERRLAEMAKRNQQMRSNIARAEQRSNLTKEEKQGDAKKKNLIRRSLDESKRRLSREKFILEQAASVPTFVAEALKKQMANKNGIHELNADKENVINCMSPPPAAVEISMEATKANVSMTGSAIKKSARLRRATISGPLREM